MSQRERDILRVMQPLLDGKRTRADAARLLQLSVRQVRRLQLKAGGDAALVHRPRGKPSNHRHRPDLRRKVLKAYRARYPDFGPTPACEKLADEGLNVGVETLRRWLLAEGLRERRRHRDPHRSRRPRRSCFGELVQTDASTHDRLEGRGGEVVLTTTTDDATSKVMARFYPAGTVEAHMDLPGRWLRKYGRPLAPYTDRHGTFEPHEKGQPLADPGAETQFGRALRGLGVELIRAHRPRAKGRVERSFGTAPDRWVEELRLAKAKTCVQADAAPERLVPDHNERFAKSASEPTDGHRRLGSAHRSESIRSLQVGRVVSNDYVVRWANRHYQLLPPVYPGEGGGRVVVEQRPDGSPAVRFGKRYLAYREVRAACGRDEAARPSEGSKKKPSKVWNPPANHPWRKRVVN